MIKFKLVLYDAQENIIYQNNVTSKRGRIDWALHNHEWHSAHIKVIYEKYDTYNEGWYYSIEDIQAALKAFTESWLMKYLAGEIEE